MRCVEAGPCGVRAVRVCAGRSACGCWHSLVWCVDARRVVRGRSLGRERALAGQCVDTVWGRPSRGVEPRCMAGIPAVRCEGGSRMARETHAVRCGDARRMVCARPSCEVGALAVRRLRRHPSRVVGTPVAWWGFARPVWCDARLCVTCGGTPSRVVGTLAVRLRNHSVAWCGVGAPVARGTPSCAPWRRSPVTSGTYAVPRGDPARPMVDARGALCGWWMRPCE